MNKRNIGFVTIVVCICMVMLTGMTVLAAGEEIETTPTDCFTWVLNRDNRSYSVSGLTEAGRELENIVIPSIYRGRPVTGVVRGTEESNFANSSNLRSIEMPEEIINIGDSAFYGCSRLEYVSMNGVEKIGNLAFYGCSSIQNIEIPNIVSIGNYGFADTAIVFINLPNTLTYLGEGVFTRCSLLEEIEIPSSITNLSKNLFYGCDNLSLVIIPDSVINIEQQAFYQCKSLTNVIIPEGVTNLGCAAFAECRGLRNVELPDSLEVIESHVFQWCENLEKIYIPSNVKVISTKTNVSNSLVNSPFYHCCENMKVYCGATSKPSGWNQYWNVSNATLMANGNYNGIKFLSTEWGVTRQEYEATFN